MTSSSESQECGPAKGQGFRHLYGPVPSRRLGRSLGVDIVPFKVCSYDCIYCTLGRTTRAVSQTEPLVSVDDVLPEIEQWLAQGGTADYITLAGSGEPTLNAHLGDMIRAARKLTSIPLAVITNGSLLARPAIQDAVSAADLLLPSLDAGTEITFQKVNRPAPGINFYEMVEGLMKTSREFHGPIWLEVMLVEGINDSTDELLEMREIIWRISPDKLQINTVERPSRSGEARPVPAGKLAEAAETLGWPCEIIAGPQVTPPDTRQWRDAESELLQLLARRPCRAGDIVAASGASLHEVTKLLHNLTQTGRVEQIGDTDPYYRYINGGYDDRS